MACGTGKTMVSLWVWEALEAPTALVVLPSISLLAQTVREWCANARTAFDFLAVCSDESVTDSDLIVRSASELPFATTTDATEIAAFLEAEADGRRVLFSTYQSTPRVAEALAVAGKSIDLVIADEAHRCAGRVDGGFSTILKDEEIPHRRLFMTATPRYLAGASSRRRRIAMSRSSRWTTRPSSGRSSTTDLRPGDLPGAPDRLPGRDHRRRGPTVPRDGRTGGPGPAGRRQGHRCANLGRTGRSAQGHGEVRPQAMRDLPLASGARKAVRGLARRCRRRLPVDERPTGRLWADHVSGAMRSASRDSRLDRLRGLDDCDRGLLANARCLAEGVDVPALDAIAFIDPSGSQVDIVQAVGRVFGRLTTSGSAPSFCRCSSATRGCGRGGQWLGVRPCLEGAKRASRS